MAAVTGEVASRRVQDGGLLKREIVPGAEMEIYLYVPGADGWVWVWAQATTVTAMPSPQGLFCVQWGSMRVPCLVADEWSEGQSPIKSFAGPCSWRWPR